MICSFLYGTASLLIYLSLVGDFNDKNFNGIEFPWNIGKFLISPNILHSIFAFYKIPNEKFSTNSSSSYYYSNNEINESSNNNNNNNEKPIIFPSSIIPFHLIFSIQNNLFIPTSILFLHYIIIILFSLFLLLQLRYFIYYHSIQYWIKWNSVINLLKLNHSNNNKNSSNSLLEILQFSPFSIHSRQQFH